MLPFLNRPTTTKTKYFIEKYPIKFIAYSIKFDKPEIEARSKELIEQIAGAPTLIGRLRHIKDLNGESLDPWKRSIFDNSKNYNLLGSSRITGRVFSDKREEIIIWAFQTTVAKIPIAIIIWEEISISYTVRRDRNERDRIEAGNKATENNKRKRHRAYLSVCAGQQGYI